MTKLIDAHQTILVETFGRFGLTKLLVSDNGTQFKTSYFKDFSKRNGIEHICSSPFYPTSNGQAERRVDMFKRTL